MQSVPSVYKYSSTAATYHTKEEELPLKNTRLSNSRNADIPDYIGKKSIQEVLSVSL